jgi:hypothetical protein
MNIATKIALLILASTVGCSACIGEPFEVAESVQNTISNSVDSDAGIDSGEKNDSRRWFIDNDYVDYLDLDSPKDSGYQPPNECNVDADCADKSTNFCQSFYCAGHVCYAGFTDITETPPQITGDCMRTVCTGTTSTEVMLVDDSDYPDDGNDCTIDRCFDGTPVFDSSTLDGSECTDQAGVAGICKKGICQ